MANGNNTAIEPDSNGRVKIPGKRKIPNFPDWNTDVYIVAPAGFAAYDKPLPSLPATTRDGQTINWFNNFGVGQRDSNSRNVLEKPNVPFPTYQVILEKLPVDKHLCLYDAKQPEGEKVQEITPQSGTGKYKYREDGNTIVIDLSLDDPPMGTFP